MRPYQRLDSGGDGGIPTSVEKFRSKHFLLLNYKGLGKTMKKSLAALLIGAVKFRPMKAILILLAAATLASAADDKRRVAGIAVDLTPLNEWLANPKAKRP